MSRVDYAGQQNDSTEPPWMPPTRLVVVAARWRENGETLAIEEALELIETGACDVHDFETNFVAVADSDGHPR